MKPQYRINFEDEGVEMVSIPLAEYEELKQITAIIKLEKELTQMFDSDVRVGLALLEQIRGL